MLSASDQLRLAREGKSLPGQATLEIAQVVMVEAFSDFAKISGDYRWVASKVTASTSKVQAPLGFAIKV